MVRYIDTKTGRFVSKSKWERSKSHGGDRYKRRNIKPARQEWHIRYHVKGVKGKRNPFYGEMTFTTPKNTTQEKADSLAAQLFRGESPKGVKFKRFEYGHKHGQLKRTIKDFDDLPDFEFLVYDEYDGYIER